MYEAPPGRVIRGWRSLAAGWGVMDGGQAGVSSCVRWAGRHPAEGAMVGVIIPWIQGVRHTADITSRQVRGGRRTLAL